MTQETVRRLPFRCYTRKGSDLDQSQQTNKTRSIEAAQVGHQPEVSWLRLGHTKSVRYVIWRAAGAGGEGRSWAWAGWAAKLQNPCL